MLKFLYVIAVLFAAAVGVVVYAFYKIFKADQDGEL